MKSAEKQRGERCGMNASDVIQRLIEEYTTAAAALSRREDVKNISAAWKALYEDFISGCSGIPALTDTVCEYYRQALANGNWEDGRCWTWLAAAHPSERYLPYFGEILRLHEAAEGDLAAVQWQILDALAWVPHEDPALWRQSEELLRQIIAYDNPCWVGSDNLHKALEAFLMNAEILALDAPVSEQERQLFAPDGGASGEQNLPLLRQMKAFCRSEQERVRAEADWWIKNTIFDPDDEDYREQLERWDIFAGISDTYA